jgi:predicted component of viral defense system (DUF524 family)
MATRASGAETWLTLNNVPLSFKRGDENLDAQAKEYHPNHLKVTPAAPIGLEVVVDDEVLKSEWAGYWIWKPPGFAGLYRLRVKAPDHRTRTALVRVLPGQMNYRRYVQMLEDISEISVDLLFSLNSPAGEKANLASLRRRPSAFREYEFIKPMIRDLATIISHIRRSPYRTLAQRTEKRLLTEIYHLSGELAPVMGPAWALPDVVAQSLGIGQLPAEWLSRENVLTFDVYENRLLKHFLWRQLLSRISDIQDKATQEITRRKQQREIKLRQGWQDDEMPQIEKLQKIKNDCLSMTRQCIAWGSEPFLRDVGLLTIGTRPTQVLQKHPYYSRFFRLYLGFQQELALSLNIERYITSLSLRRMSQLYETWSVFKLTHLLLHILSQAGYRVVSSSGFFDVKEDGFTFDVRRNAGIELAKNGLKVRIVYEPVYQSQRRVGSGLVSRGRSQLSPDLAVEAWDGDEARSVLVFDAKFRASEEEGRRVYWEKDRDKMDRYANSILWKPPNPRQRPRRIVSSAYILYPGDVLEHDSHYPEVGALPFVPEMEKPREFARVVVQLLRYAGLLTSGSMRKP